jgi:hypothetical protein
LLEFLLRVPEPIYRQNGIPRSFARRVFADRLPPEIILETRRGYQGAAWFKRMDVRRAALVEEVERLNASPLASRLLMCRAWNAPWATGRGMLEPPSHARMKSALPSPGAFMSASSFAGSRAATPEGPDFGKWLVSEELNRGNAKRLAGLQSAAIIISGCVMKDSRVSRPVALMRQQYRPLSVRNSSEAGSKGARHRRVGGLSRGASLGRYGDRISKRKKAPRKTAGLFSEAGKAAYEIMKRNEAFRSWQTWRRPTLPSLET